ncbi:hypothetical protein GGI20_005372 [Coemansia sp. BCRC 34301]|nr:hypothetical protein GGI20_005372 [Coemansia sp. BCRC 34301]
MEPETPPRNALRAPPVMQTPINRVLQRVDQLTPTSRHGAAGMSPFGSPALRKLDEGALRDRLRDAYALLKEKEKNLFLAATVGQELVDANQQLQDSYEQMQAELAEVRSAEQTRLHGRRQSMQVQQGDGRRENSDDEADREKHWMRVHVQPLKTQLEMAHERTDELLGEREGLAAQIYGLKQEQAAALRRAADSAAACGSAQARVDQLEEDKVQLQRELDEQRAFWTRRWSEHQASLRASANDSHNDGQRAGDAAARLRAEQRAESAQARLGVVQAEVELLRSQMQRLEDERVSEWEPLRARWLGCEEALQELQDSHQVTCDSLVAAEARLADLDRTDVDPVRLASDKTSTSLLGELDAQRHTAVAQQQALAREHGALKRAYGRALASQARMRQQVARLTQLAATGASEARMRRLEAALGEAECQHQALLWASMDHRRVSPDTEVAAEADATALVTALRAKLKLVTADREQAHRELRTAHLLRANEIQRTRDIEREAADTEAKLRRAVGDLSVLRADHDALKRAVKSARKQVSSPHAAAHKPADQPDSPDADRQLPPKKRTGPRIKPSGSPVPKARGPMSLAFVVNSNSETPNSETPNSEACVNPPQQQQPASPCGLHRASPPPASDSAKRRRAPGTPVGIRAAKQSLLMASDAAPTEPADDASDINQAAADRGLKSWLGTLGAVHASATVSDHLASGYDAESAPATSNTKPQEPAASISPAPVDEIYINSRMSQKPIECNTQ